jgi:PIN domain-containing protein
MIYLALDNCVWIELLKTTITSENNVFDELMYWINGKEIQSITTENLIREWNRTKIKQYKNILQAHKSFAYNFRINESVSPYRESEYLENLVSSRIQKIDAILNSQSEIAKESTEIILKAWERNYNEQAPNHSKDSFRDSMNILCLLNHLRARQSRPCFFATINYNDFSAPDDKYSPHPHLLPDFTEVSLGYVFFESEMSKNKLFNHYLRPKLSDYQNFLSEKRKQEVESQKKETQSALITVEVPDDEYLDSLHYIDDILAKRKLSKSDMKIIEMLINSHDSYKQYFLRKVGDNDLV